jgi:glycosyltransferase involved in cell wall biosynthesis
MMVVACCIFVACATGFGHDLIPESTSKQLRHSVSCVHSRPARQQVLRLSHQVRKGVHTVIRRKLRRRGAAKEVISSTGVRVRVVQLAMGGYRQGLLDYLESRGSTAVFYVGDRHFSPNLRTTVRSSLVVSTGQNLYLFGGRLGFQRQVVWPVGTSRGPVVVELNPRVVSSWAIVVMRALLSRRPTYGWGHFYSRRGAEAKSNSLRRLMQRLCTGLFVYTISEAEAARSIFRSKQVLIAANALYRSSELTTPESGRRSAFAIVGRLVDDKKPLLGLEGFRKALAGLPIDCKLHIVGDGPLRSELCSKVASESAFEGRVVLHGHVDDRNRLHELFSGCIALVAPGYVGLNVTQALGFGVPVIYADKEPHAPEVEQLTTANSVTFTAEDSVDLARKLVDAAAGHSWYFNHEGIVREIRERYTVEKMGSAFIRLEQN